MQESTVPRRRWWPALKWTLFALMLYFVAMRAVSLWRSSPSTDLHVNIAWLVPAALLYLVGWVPSVWLWRALLKRLNQRAERYASFRAHFIGQLGKYVPGKALVLVIRSEFLKRAGINPVLAAVTAAYETLISMAAGAAIAAALAPSVVPEGIWQRLPAALQFLRHQPLLVPLLVAVVTVATTPLTAWLFTRIGRKAVPHAADNTSAGITAGLVLQGVLITSLGWLCHALSLGCTLQSVSSDRFDVSQFPVWLASVALSTFAGFIILVAPGGLGVREWVLIEILKDQPAVGGDKAIIVAGLLRLVWFIAELCAAGLLYLIKPRGENTATPPTADPIAPDGVR